MSKKKTKLELTWIGKENRPKLEPRVLIEDPDKSYHAKHRVSENDIFDNRLIYGDNLLALKALEQEFSGSVKCIFIDPPYNTGSAFDHYEDGLEHSLWLGLMRDRLEILHRLLSENGSLWITIDDNECHYLKIMCDEIFGRQNFVANAIWQKKFSPQNDAKWLSNDHDHILCYAKNKELWRPNLLNRSEGMDKRYKNPDSDPRGPWASTDLTRAEHRDRDFWGFVTPSGEEVFPAQGRSWSRPKENIEKLQSEGLLWFGPNGDRMPRLKKFLYEVREGVTPQTIWFHGDVGNTQEAKKEIKALDFETIFDTPKPERLLRRVIEIASNHGDLILDSFAGSGTTGAVAHKLGRRWILIELGEQAYTHIIPRMRKVIDGTDRVGISVGRTLIWESKLTVTKIKNGSDLFDEMREAQDEIEQEFAGYEKKLEDGHIRLYGLSNEADVAKGGGFRYYKIGPSLITEDAWGNPVINPDFNAALLAEAMSKLEGFTYEPNPEVYWQQGRSSEADFIYVTTQFMSKDMLTQISEEVGPGRSLLICCSAFRCDPSQFENLTVKKIPKAVLKKCEWGHDDYSLAIENLPDAPEGQQRDEGDAVPKKPARKFGKGKDDGPMLFEAAAAEKGGK